MWICLYFCLALSFNILQVNSQKFHWEDYDGTIPEKAFSITADDPDKPPLYVGMTKVDEENCTGTLQPEATELIVECKDKVYIAKCLENIKILTLEDPTKAIWMYRKTDGDRSNMWSDFKKAKVGVVNSGTSKKRQKTTTMVGRTKMEDGSVIAGHVNVGIFRSVDNNNKKVTKNKDYDILVIKNE